MFFDQDASEQQDHQVTQPQAHTNQGESSIQRLKRQRNEARQEVEALKNEMDLIRAQVQGLQSQPKVQGGYTRPEDWPIEELEAYALRQDVVDESPHLAMQAMMLWAKKLVADSEQRNGNNVKQEILGMVQAKDEISNAWREVAHKYGSQNVAKGSDLYEEADQIYTSYTQRYGQVGQNGKPIQLPASYLVMAFEEAKKNLDARQPVDQDQQPQIPQAEPQQQAGIFNKPAGPAPSDLVVGTSEGTADALASRREMIKQGDTQGAFASMAKQLGY
jgi:hypothetical protein